MTLQDYENWRKEFRDETTTKIADFNNDDKTSLIDYEIWRINVDRSSFPLVSNFFKKNTTAQSIVSGTQYQMQEGNYFVPGGGGRLASSSFEYAVINALRQLGYNNLTFTKNSGDTAVNVGLHMFETKHNLPLTDYLDKNVLLLLDQELAEREQTDRQQAISYAPYAAFTDSSPLNEPAQEHFAAMLATFFSALPTTITTNTPGEGNVITMDQFRISLGAPRFRWLGKMLNPQTLTVLTDIQMREIIQTKGDFRYCAEYYYNIYAGSDCAFPQDNPLTIGEDFQYMTFHAHEYGHGVGGYFSPAHNNSRYDLLFAQISFTFPGDGSIRRPANTNNEFMSLYAQTNGGEDFAESFSAYMHMGNIFRERAKKDPYLQQKYQFLKQTVFQGVEYDTGTIDSLNKWNASNTAIPNNFELYLKYDPDWMWNYQYKIL